VEQQRQGELEARSQREVQAEQLRRDGLAEAFIRSASLRDPVIRVVEAVIPEQSGRPSNPSPDEWLRHISREALHDAQPDLEDPGVVSEGGILSYRLPYALFVMVMLAWSIMFPLAQLALTVGWLLARFLAGLFIIILSQLSFTLVYTMGCAGGFVLVASALRSPRPHGWYRRHGGGVWWGRYHSPPHLYCPHRPTVMVTMPGHGRGMGSRTLGDGD
jgi:hypothetical protein